jgi:hypothetical protein
MPATALALEEVAQKELQRLIPKKSKNYVPFGCYEDIKEIIESKSFYPVLITGHKGNGKTIAVKQACAELERPFIRFNFTRATDESDMLGRHKLVEKNGVTISEWEEGIFVYAIRNGVVLLCDEFDVADTNRIMCLQSILEGEGVLIKATGEWVRPVKIDPTTGKEVHNGFQIFLTGNTKGRGSEDGQYIGTQVMNAAFLDRIGGVVYQDYPPKDIEATILKNHFVDFMWLSKGVKPKDIPAADAAIVMGFINNLIEWADDIRETYKAKGEGEVVTTRTLINVARGFSVFKDKEKSVLLACERFTDEIRDQFVGIYKKLADQPEAHMNAAPKVAEVDSNGDEISI